MQSAPALEAWSKIRLPARLDAMPSPEAKSLIVVAPGMGMSRTSYATLALDLASHGYCVATFDPPDCSFRVKNGLWDVEPMPMNPYSDTTLGEVSRRWAGDMAFIAETLRANSYCERLAFLGQPESEQHGKFVIEWVRQADGNWLIQRFYRIPIATSEPVPAE